MDKQVHRTCKSLFLIATLLAYLPFGVKAESFIQDVFRYNITSTTEYTVEVAGLADATLDEYVIPDTVIYNKEKYTVTKIGDNAFTDCSLKAIIMPNSIKTLGQYCFMGCSSLKSVKLSSKITFINKLCFGGCSSLSSITIPDSVTDFDISCFKDCTSLTAIDFSDNIKHIGHECFTNCTSLTSIIIPSSVETIGNECFKNCTGLTSVTILNGVNSIGSQCFGHCTSLTSITIPNSVKNINETFTNCTSLTSVVIPDNIESLYRAFYSCTSLTSVTIPNSVKNITNSFGNCKSLTSIIIPNSVTNINGAFTDCINLTSVNIPNSVTNIDESFRGCTSLTSVEIPKSITTISKTFQDCTSLTSITIPNSVKNISGAFNRCSNLTTVNLSESVKNIGNYTFENCSSLDSITIPKNVTTIGSYAFDHCSNLKSITLSEKLTEIGSYIFSSCTQLAKIHVLNPIPAVVTHGGGIANFNILNSCKLYVPKGSKAAYQVADEWKEFKSIIDGSEPEIPNLDIKLYANGFSEYMAKDQNIRACIYFTSSDTTVPVCFRYRLKDIDWKSKVTLSHAQSTTASKTPFQFDDQGIAWIDTPDGYEVKNGQLINYIIPKFLETGVMDYEIAVYDQTKTTKYATFDCSVQAINTVNYSLPEIKGAKDTDIPFTLTVANAGDFAGKKVKVQISAYKADTDSTTIQYVKEETQEAIKLASSQSKTMVEVEHIIPSLSATSYQFTFRSTCNLSDQDLTIVLVDPSNDWMIPDGKTVKINITDKAPEGETTFTSGALTYKTLDNSTVAIAGITDATKTEYTIPSTVMHNNKNYTVTKIGEDAFVKATGLLSIDIPSSVITIEKAAFAACEKLQSVTLHEGLKTIGREAFSGCASLQSIDIPASVTQIEEGAIEDCLQLSEITVKEGNQQYTSVDGVLFNNIKNKLLAYPNGHGATYTIPSNVTCIGRGAFAGCEALTDITIPEGVRVIEQEAFKWCSGLTSITIPESIVVLNILDVRYDFPSVFEGCDETLQEIHWKSPTPIDLGEYGQHVFFYYSDDIQTGHSTCKLFVPKGSKAAYKNAPGWKYFKNIIEEDEDEDNSNKPLTPPSPESDITISGDSTYTDADGTKDKFNGTIGSDEKETVINTLVLNGSISTATTIVFNHVTVGDGSSAQTSTSVTSKTNVVIELIGDNSLGKLVNDGITKLTGASNAALHNTTVVNNGVFTDETTFITQVEGPAGLNITAPTDREVTEGSSVTLATSTKVGDTYSITFIWEQLQTNGTWKQIAAHSPVRSSLRATEITVKDQLTITPEETCQYRCRIKNEVGNVSTTLNTVPATVTVNPTDVGNATIDSDNKVYVHDGVLYFQLTTPTEAQIIHFNGTVMRNLRLPAGETRVDGLTEGFYIIRYKGNKTVKVTI